MPDKHHEVQQKSQRNNISEGTKNDPAVNGGLEGVNVLITGAQKGGGRS